MTLTDKQRAFCIEYIKDYNATQAAIRAGYSEVSARYIGYENLQKPHILQYISDHFESNVMSANEVLSHLTDVARGVDPDASVGERINALKELAKFHQLTTSNTQRIEDWKSDAIKAIVSSRIDYDELRWVCADMGHDESLADELFKLANVRIPD